MDLLERNEHTVLSDISVIPPSDLESQLSHTDVDDGSKSFDVNVWHQGFQQLPSDIGNAVQTLVATQLQHIDRAAMILTKQKKVLQMKETRISELSTMIEAFVKRLHSLQVSQSARTLPKAQQLAGVRSMDVASRTSTEPSRQPESTALHDQQSHKVQHMHPVVQQIENSSPLASESLPKDTIEERGEVETNITNLSRKECAPEEPNCTSISLSYRVQQQDSDRLPHGVTCIEEGSSKEGTFVEHDWDTVMSSQNMVIQKRNDEQSFNDVTPTTPGTLPESCETNLPESPRLPVAPLEEIPESAEEFPITPMIVERNTMQAESCQERKFVDPMVVQQQGDDRVLDDVASTSPGKLPESCDTNLQESPRLPVESLEEIPEMTEEFAITPAFVERITTPAELHCGHDEPLKPQASDVLQTVEKRHMDEHCNRLIPQTEACSSLSISSGRESCESDEPTNPLPYIDRKQERQKPSIEPDATLMGGADRRTASHESKERLEILEQAGHPEDIMAAWATSWQPLMDNLAEAEKHYVEQQGQIEKQIVEIEEHRTKQQDLERRLAESELRCVAQKQLEARLAESESRRCVAQKQLEDHLAESELHCAAQKQLEDRLAESESRCAEYDCRCEKLVAEVDSLHAFKQKLEQQVLEVEQKGKAVKEHASDLENVCRVLKERLDTTSQSLDEVKASGQREKMNWDAEREELQAEARARQAALEDAASKAKAQIESLQRHAEYLAKDLESNKNQLSMREARMHEYEQKRRELQAEEDALAENMIKMNSGVRLAPKAGDISESHRDVSVRNGIRDMHRPLEDVILPPLQYSRSEPQLPRIHIPGLKKEVGKISHSPHLGNKYFQNELRALARHSMMR